LLLRSQQRHVYTKNAYKPHNHKPQQHGETPRLPRSSHQSVAPDKISAQHIIRTICLKWRNALPWRIKWSKRIAWSGVAISMGLGVLWVKFQEEVPFSGRKRLNFFGGTGDFQKYMLGHKQQCLASVSYLEKILVLAPRNPGLIWPDDHPMTVVVKSIFNRLVASSGVDPAGWAVYIANAPSKSPT
jgi:hypothetical protein